MTNFFQKLFGIKPKYSFKGVDWLAVEGKIRHIDTLAASADQATIKQSIIQSDILVDMIMKEAGIRGASMGERLKSVRDVMPRPVYSQLWQAHIKRNELVHEPGSFVADWEKDKYLKAFTEAISAMRGIR